VAHFAGIFPEQNAWLDRTVTIGAAQAIPCEDCHQ
jgi:hypothetical protein